MPQPEKRWRKSREANGLVKVRKCGANYRRSHLNRGRKWKSHQTESAHVRADCIANDVAAVSALSSPSHALAARTHMNPLSITVQPPSTSPSPRAPQTTAQIGDTSGLPKSPKSPRMKLLREKPNWAEDTPVFFQNEEPDKFGKFFGRYYWMDIATQTQRAYAPFPEDNSATPPDWALPHAYYRIGGSDTGGGGGSWYWVDAETNAYMVIATNINQIPKGKNKSASTTAATKVTKKQEPKQKKPYQSHEDYINQVAWEQEREEQRMMNQHWKMEQEARDLGYLNLAHCMGEVEGYGPYAKRSGGKQQDSSSGNNPSGDDQ